MPQKIIRKTLAIADILLVLVVSFLIVVAPSTRQAPKPQAPNTQAPQTAKPQAAPAVLHHHFRPRRDNC